MELIISASEFKAKCLDIFERLSTRRLDKVTITKRGRTVAVVTPPEAREDKVRAEIAALKGGRVSIPGDFDWFAPVLDGPTDAELGILHR